MEFKLLKHPEIKGENLRKEGEGEEEKRKEARRDKDRQRWVIDGERDRE